MQCRGHPRPGRDRHDVGGLRLAIDGSSSTSADGAVGRVPLVAGMVRVAPTPIVDTTLRALVC